MRICSRVIVTGDGPLGFDTLVIVRLINSVPGLLALTGCPLVGGVYTSVRGQRPP